MGFLADAVNTAFDVIGIAYEKVKNCIIKVHDFISGFFSKFRNWILKTGEKIKNLIQGILLGVKLYVQKLAGGIYRKITSHFTNNNGVLEETRTQKKIPAEEVPPEFIELAELHERADLTNQFNEQLQVLY